MSFNLTYFHWDWIRNRILNNGFSRWILQGDSQESDFGHPSLGNPGIDKISIKIKFSGSKSYEFGHPKKTRNAITSRMVRFSARELCSEVHLCKKC